VGALGDMASQPMLLKVLGRDKLSGNDTIGEIKLPLDGLKTRNRIEFTQWKLEKLPAQAVSTISLTVSWVSREEAQSENASAPVPAAPTAAAPVPAAKTSAPKPTVGVPKAERSAQLGDLELHLIGANNLPAADKNGLSDPYVAIKVGKAKTWKSAVLQRTLEPTWNQKYNVSGRLSDLITQKMLIKVMDKDKLQFDDVLGELSVDLKELLEQDVVEFNELALSRKAKREDQAYETMSQGTITFSLTWKPRPYKDVEMTT